MKRDKTSSKTPSLKPEHQEVLHNQRIDENSPGTILRDFEILLDFIGSQTIKVSETYNLLPIMLLPELNARLTHPIQIGIKRPQQKSYPHINGLYLLLRATGLAFVEGTGTKQTLVLDNTILRSWRSLSATERYCTLLEAWIIRSRPEIVGEDRGWFDLPIPKCSQFFQQIPARGLKVAGNKEMDRLLVYYPGFYTLALLELFGFVSIEHGTPEKGKGWCITSVHRTAFGDALLQLLLNLFEASEYQWTYESDMNTPFGELQPGLRPYFPEWRNNLAIPKSEFQDGLYIFKVSLGRDIWRRIAIPAKSDLDSLSSTILDAFDFDYDHLYYFAYKNRFGVTMRINHPYMEDEPPLTTEVRIGDLPLKPGASMVYLYDFGDNWEFDVKLERIDPPDRKVKKPAILETHGESPEQYPNWDDEEWGEEEEESDEE